MLDNPSHQQLLSELLRPKVLADLAISNKITSALDGVIKRRSVPNVLFYGPPGSGKTSAARIIAENFDTLQINGSDQRKARTTMSGIEQFAMTVSLPIFDDGPKIVLIDEGDCLPKESQEMLRAFMEQVSNHCRFIFTANDRVKLLPAIQSRLTPVDFTVPYVESAEIIERYTVGLCEKLVCLNYEVDSNYVRTRVKSRFPDFRSIANDIELYGATPSRIS